MPVLYESPGSVRNQVGLSLCEIRDRISQGDLPGMADHIRYLVALTSPFINKKGSKVDKDKLKVKMPTKESKDPENELFESCMNVLDLLLPLLAEEGLYAYVRGGYADGSDLANEPEEIS